MAKKNSSFINSFNFSTNLITHSNGEHIEDGMVIDNQNHHDEDQTKQLGEDDDHQQKRNEVLEREIDALDNAWHAGVVHLIGENEVVASKESGIAKRIVIDYAYRFLKKNLRQSDKLFDIPHKRMLKVGMTYEL